MYRLLQSKVTLTCSACAAGLLFAGCGGGGGSSTATTDTVVNAVPVFTSASTASVAENSTAVMTVAASDPEGTTVTYAISGGSDAAQFTLDNSTGVLAFATAPDFEAPADSGADNVYEVDVTATDADGKSTVQGITATVTDDLADNATAKMTRFLASDAAVGDSYGQSVAFEGNRFVVGVTGDDDGGLNSGAVYVYDFDGTDWLETKLTASDAAGADTFGDSVALSGNRIAVGASGDGSSTGSVYVYDFDGTDWIETKLIASDAAPYDRYGCSVALENDRIVVGAYMDDDNGDWSGSAYVYDFDGTNWIETKLIASDGATYDSFGFSVALSGDRIAVGAYSDDDGGFNSGAVYVYDYDGTTWTESKLTASDAFSRAHFGYSLALEGDRMVVGNDNASGSVYVYDFDGTTWVESTLTAPDQATWDGFGLWVALEGSNILVSAPSSDALWSAENGAAYLYNYDGSQWQFSRKLTTQYQQQDKQAFTQAAISGDKILLGANDASLALGTGEVYLYDMALADTTAPRVAAAMQMRESGVATMMAVDGDDLADGHARYGLTYELTGGADAAGFSMSTDGILTSADGLDFEVPSDSNGDGTYELQVSVSDGVNTTLKDVALSVTDKQLIEKLKLTTLNVTSNAQFGNSVAISGSRLVVGAHQDNSGSVFVYDYDGSAWLESKLTPSDGASSDRFGASVAVDGNRVVVGAYNDDDAGISSGSAYVFDFDGTNWVETKLTASDAAAEDFYGYSVALKGDRIVVGSVYADGANADAGKAYVYDFDGTTWNETLLSASDEAATDWFGYSVALSGDRIAVGSFLDDDKGGSSGSVYIYDFDGTTWNESKIVASDGGPSDGFGGSVALDGDRLLVGANGDDDGGSDSGAVYVYDFDGTAWNETKIITPDIFSFDAFGTSVALSGNRFVASATWEDTIYASSGALYVYDFDGSVWNMTEKLVASEEISGNGFGKSVALDGPNVVTGAQQNDSGFGAVHIFTDDPNQP